LCILHDDRYKRLDEFYRHDSHLSPASYGELCLRLGGEMSSMRGALLGLLLGALLVPAFSWERASALQSAGAHISDTSTVTFSDQYSNTYSASSNTLSIYVQNAPALTITDPAPESVTPADLEIDTFSLVNTGNNTGTFALTADATFGGTATGTTLKGYVLNGATSGTCSTGTLCTTYTALNSAITSVIAGNSINVAVEFQVSSAATTGQTVQPSITANIAYAAGTGTSLATSSNLSNTTYSDTLIVDARLDIQASATAPSSSGANITWTITANDGGGYAAQGLASAQTLFGAANPGIAIFIPMPTLNSTYLQLQATPSAPTLTGASGGSVAAVYYNATPCSSHPTSAWSTTYNATAECLAIYVSNSSATILPATGGSSGAGSVSTAQISFSFATNQPSGTGSTSANSVTLIASSAIGGNPWETNAVPITGQGLGVGASTDAATATLLNAIQSNATASSGTTPPGGASNLAGSQAAPLPSVPTGVQVSSNGAATLYTVSWNASAGATTYNLYRGTTAGTESGTAYQTAIGTTSYADTVTAAAAHCYKVSAVSAGGESAHSAEVCETGVVYNTTRIAAGAGGAFAPFSADMDYSGTGSTTANTASAITTSGVLCSPAPTGVYQNNRWIPAGNDLIYTITGLSALTPYLVRLHFAETYAPFVAGSRQFNVSINGTSVLTNFDIYAASGGTNKAVVREFLQNSQSGGSMVIDFSHGAADNPQINGLEVIQVPQLTTLNMLLSLSATGAQTPGTDLTYSGNFTSNATATSVVITVPVSASTYFKFNSASVASLIAGLALSSTTYSNNNGTSYLYPPASGGGTAPSGYDSNVTNVKWTFTGTLCQSATSAGIVSFSARIR
jgi:Malectin domain